MQSPRPIIAQSDLLHCAGGPDFLCRKCHRGCRQVSLPGTDAGSLQVDDMRLAAVRRHHCHCPSSQASGGWFEGDHNTAAYKAIEDRWTEVLANLKSVPCTLMLLKVTALGYPLPLP